jgi:hypothetical protein
MNHREIKSFEVSIMRPIHSYKYPGLCVLQLAYAGVTSANPAVAIRSTVLLAALLVAGASVLSRQALADVPNVFAPGNPILAEEVNENFGDLDTRLTGTENSLNRFDFSGYWVGFPADGQASNVVLLGRYDFDDTLTGYNIRWGSNNSGDQISVNGVLTTRQYIFHYSFVSIDPGNGSITYISDYIESPDTEEYLTYLVEESEFDPVSLVKTILPDGDTLRGTESCGNSVVLICIVQFTLSANGAFHSISDYSRGRVLATNVNIGGGWPVFTDVRLEKFFGSGQLRIRAKGIGTIYQRYDSGYDRLLYYRNDGVTGGSLAGTPFDTGQPLDGLFF